MSVQDDQAHRRIIFRDWDADKSGLLNKTELHAMMGGSDEDKSAMIQQEREMVIFQVPCSGCCVSLGSCVSLDPVCLGLQCVAVRSYFVMARSSWKTTTRTGTATCPSR
jgi:hypothetical protein